MVSTMTMGCDNLDDQAFGSAHVIVVWRASDQLATRPSYSFSVNTERRSRLNDTWPPLMAIATTPVRWSLVNASLRLRSS